MESIKVLNKQVHKVLIDYSKLNVILDPYFTY